MKKGPNAANDLYPFCVLLKETGQVLIPVFCRTLLTDYKALLPLYLQSRLPKRMKWCFLLLSFILTPLAALTQPLNDNCSTAIHIFNTIEWCSEPGQFTNVNATSHVGPQPSNSCFQQYDNDVWFTFIPNTPAIYIRVSGATFGLGTLRNPGITIFEGSCGNLNIVACNSTSSTNLVEVAAENLTLGAVYYLMVEGYNLNQGTFQICTEGFIPPPSPQSDCSKAVILCDKSTFVVDTLLSIGIPDPGVTNTCVMQELSSAWYKWICDESGTLSFTLTPNNYLDGFESDDIDFVLYELPNGIDDCSVKFPIRCMAAGANVQEPFQSWRRCNGPTGLRDGESDTEEQAGCAPGNNNFVSSVNMVAGKAYALLINNFSQSGLGFRMEFGGSGTFQGPEPAFDVTAVQAFECDKTVIFNNLSNAPTDPIVSYYWNFGAGANPPSSNDPGPINVIYDSFGEKRVALTVTSSKGCTVTELLDFYVEPCCKDTSTLAVQAIVGDQICPGTNSGYIQGIGISGSPLYQFSLDCEVYQPSTVFPFLPPGEYTLCIQDEKGCINQLDVDIDPATGFYVEAGDTIFLKLGESGQINATVFPLWPESVMWNYPQNLTFFDSTIPSQLSPTVKPTTTAWYVVTIENEYGCTTLDSVLIVVDAYKPIYIPNVITANNDGINDLLTVYGNFAATNVDVFEIYDRWGGLVWARSDFALNDETLGWNGKFGDSGTEVPVGVYAYRAVVNFVDNIPLTFHGSVTVIR